VKRRTRVALAGIGWTAFGAGVPAQDARPERQADPPAPAAREVTLTGNVLSHVHLGEKARSVFLLAYDGTPEVRAEFERIVAGHFPEQGLDADAAARLQDQFMSRLRYDIAPGAVADALAREAEWTVRGPKAVTGTVEEKDGRKWITPRQVAGADFAFPARMLAPDKPFTMPDREPLVLTIGDALSLKCLWVPPGTFLMGEPYYQCPHWQEDPPRRVTLTRGFYLAEHPVTREMVEAVVGGGAAAGGEPKAPANASCATMVAFCRLLSRRSGRNVRVPTAAEWEYAARVGTSNPTFKEKYKGQDSSPAGAARVKSMPPNAWGFHDMFGSGWERVSDGSGAIDRRDATDPQHIPPEDLGPADGTRPHGHFGKGNAGFAISEVEYITSEPGPEKTYPGVIRFRVVVEAAAK
jgi:hypothetical protein